MAKSYHQIFCSAIMFFLLLLFVSPAAGQLTPQVGIRQNPPTIHALVGAKLFLTPDKMIENGTVVIRDGFIVDAGKEVRIPDDARIWDMKGMTIYPGFIDCYSDLGMPRRAQESFGGDQGQQQKPQEPARGPKHWNEHVQASVNAEEIFTPDPRASEKLRGLGFTAALVVPQQGVFRGTSALINLGDGTTSQNLVKSRIAQHVAFETSRGDGYPNSLMGAIALIRQTVLDAQWYRDATKDALKYPGEPKPEIVDDLASLENVVDMKQPLIFETGDEQSILRAAAIAKEFHLQYFVRGSGYEYRRLDAIKILGIPIILPVNFPEPPSVQTPEEALNVDIEDLRHWDEAPENPGKLFKAGVSFALTTSMLKDVTNFLPNVRKAVQRGLPEQIALAGLTTIPARLCGAEKSLGTISRGNLANLIVADGNIFNEKTKIRETWIEGKRYEIKPQEEIEVRGTWKVALSGHPSDSLRLILKGEPDGLQGSMKSGTKEAKLSTAVFSDLRLAVTFPGDSIGMSGIVRMTAVLTPDRLTGTGEFSDGKQFSWNGQRVEKFVTPRDTTHQKPPEMSLLTPLYPPGAFGREMLPAQPDHILVRGATIWTCAQQGIIDNGDLLVERGKVIKVGTNLSAPPDAVVIAGNGKHVTPGLIDCHSHTGVAGGVNETGVTITAQVRIGDVLDPDDIALYRELAGGLTVANVLHGSANPIGGQNQVIKLRWGVLPEEMKFEGAMPGIKFALGENPKQSNWGDRYSSRYPQTREGVEQMIRDEFRAALDYEKTWKEYEQGSRRIKPRRDLHAEAILEVLHGKRLVHAHSYRQDEIEMLIRVADEFGFKIGTFQHVLEGYKIADLMNGHGAGGSTFSDWWAYKFEVYDAIPYNGTLMHDAGVVVSFNSDSDELARHLNTEAAKAVKYGGLSEEEALKFVTINPAIQLRIEKRVGSLEPGKDADFVIWSGNPLSGFSMCEQTWIDGKKYFDRQEDRAMSEKIQHERSSLIQKVLSSAKSGGGEPKRPPSRGEKAGYSCHENFNGEGGR